jgi:ATP citrate (pro-S)-lyase
MMVLLGEVGGIDEYAVCEAMKSGRITKPLVSWVMGTCASIFPYEVQFGHAGASARGDLETAAAKNSALAAAGAHVPKSFDAIGEKIFEVYDSLVKSGAIIPKPEPAAPKIPMDYSWAKRLGLIRKPASFISTISDDRGDELTYAGMPISDAIKENIGVGGVLSLLWFRRRLPEYATKFIEMVLMVSADHGPAVSGAHNTIVAARAGKDLVSALASGLLTIGPRFGGALDDAASMFRTAVDQGEDAASFVNSMRKKNILIMGIGHKIRTIQNPDMRVKIIKEYAQKHFPRTPVLDFALAVEQVTTKKKATLILNVDGCIAACFVDLLRDCGAFDKTEADELIDNGCLNGLFVTGRTIGFIGHYIDQKRLKQGLYRHPWDDISYQTDL